MKIFIKAKPGSKSAKISKIDETHYEVCVKEPAAEGKANEAVIKAVAKYFGVVKPRVKILSGKTSKQKLFEIS